MFKKTEDKNKSIKELIARAVELEDHTETKTAGGDFEYTVPPAGKTVGRFTDYIELGKHPQRAFRGKDKPDAEMVRVVFELLSPKKNIRTVGEGKDARQIADRISLVLAKGLFERSKYKKLFETMRRGRSDITHMAQMLGEPFFITVIHNESEKDGKKRTYANIDKDGAYLLEAPQIEDPIAETVTQVEVPNAISDLALFIWDIPTVESWNRLFIDGESTKKDKDGVETTSSKNWLQAKILSATNFAGSPLEQMLQEAGVDVSGIEAAEPAHEAEVEEVEEVEAPVEKPVAKKSTQKAATSAVASSAPKDTVKSAATPTINKAAPAVKTAASKGTTPAKVAAPAKSAPKAEAEDPLVALGLA